MEPTSTAVEPGVEPTFEPPPAVDPNALSRSRRAAVLEVLQSAVDDTAYDVVYAQVPASAKVLAKGLWYIKYD